MPIILQNQGLVPPDSGMGDVGRGGLAGLPNERVASLETLFDYFINAVTDPDRSLSKDQAFYDKLMRHPWVSACMNIREQKVASMVSKVEIAQEHEDDPQAQAAQQWVSSVWAAVKDKDLIFQELQQAVLQGGQPHEWIWQVFPDGTQRPVRAMPVSKTRFQFNRTGDIALLSRMNPVWGSYVGSNPSNPQQPRSPLPMGKFTYHVYERMGGSWNRPHDEGYIYYGRGEGEDLYDTVIRDLACWLLEMQWLRMYGNPNRQLVGPEGQQYRGWSQQIIDDILTKQIAFLPDVPGGQCARRLFELVVPNVPAPAFDAFGKSHQRHYDQIEAVILGSVGVLSNQDAESRASHQSRQDSGPDMLKRRDATRISGTLSSQLVPAILRYGPPQLRECPQELMPSIILYDEDDWSIEDLGTAAKLFALPKSWAYKTAKIPEPAIDSETGEEEETIGGQADPMELMDAGGAPPESPQGKPDETEPSRADRLRKLIGRKEGGNGED